jgi:hypothetical protein
MLESELVPLAKDPGRRLTPALHLRGRANESPTALATSPPASAPILPIRLLTSTEAGGKREATTRGSGLASANLGRAQAGPGDHSFRRIPRSRAVATASARLAAPSLVRILLT